MGHRGKRLRESAEVLRCTPLRGIDSLKLGMTLDSATALLGAPRRVAKERFEASWGADLRCFFSAEWSLIEIAVVGGPDARRVELGDDVLLSRDFDVAAEQLLGYAGEGYRHPKQHLVVFPKQGLRLWSEEGVWADSFECATLERCTSVLSGWPDKYARMREEDFPAD